MFANRGSIDLYKINVLTPTEEELRGVRDKVPGGFFQNKVPSSRIGEGGSPEGEEGGLSER